MNCRRIEPLLFDLVEGLLSEREAAAVAAHLAGCSSCRRRRDSYLTLRAGLRGLSELQPPPHLARRAIQRWAAERAASPHAANHEARMSAVRMTAAGRLVGAVRCAAALVALALMGVALSRWNRAAPLRRPAQIVQRAEGTMPQPRSNGEAGNRLASSRGPSPGVSSRTGDGRTGKIRDAVGFLSDPFHESAPLSASPHHVERPGPALSLAPRDDDLSYLNGSDPVRDVRPWAPVACGEWAAIEAKVRREVRVKDDFVQIPFPRIAGASEGAIVAAVEQYKHEAAIVDPRLFQEVSLAQKATALSDLCDHLRSETGIQLTAGPSVADEKVTVFCEKLPLRDVMRQLSRPFGYTWLRSKKEDGEYRYELVQDLKSQLLEEELRNRDRDAALIAVDQEMARYRPFLNLSPDEALARAKTAGEGDKELLEKLGGAGWGPIQMYFKLSAPEQAALQAGQELRFSQEPAAGEMPLPSDLARGVLESMRGLRLARREGTLRPAGPGEVDAMPLTAVSEARALVTLSLQQSELGRYDVNGGAGYTIAGDNMMSLTGNGPYAVGVSPTVREPENGTVNAVLARDPALQGKVTAKAVDSGGWLVDRPTGVGPKTGPSSPARTTIHQPLSTDRKITTADVLEALHRATGLPIVSDFYTRLYPPEVASVKDERLFDALNHLADAMRLRWHKEGSWLQFRSASYYDDRPKEVPNRLLKRWAAARQEHGALSLDELIQIAQLSDQQLDAASMAEGAKAIWGLDEWDLARDAIARRHLRFLAQCTPAQRQLATSPDGLAFTRLSLAQQQQFIILAFATSPVAYTLPPPNVRLEALAGAKLRVCYSLPGGFECRAAAGTESPAEGLSVVWAPTRGAALEAARRLDPRVEPEQIVPSERALTFLYTYGDPKSGLQAVAVRKTTNGVDIW